jgi:hypothetical protein
LALHNFESKHGHLPPAAVRSGDGKPLLSWRVLILPYIEQQELYDQFKLDEPWDSEHNIKLLEKMPSTYAQPRRKAGSVPPYHTICHVFVGEGTLFERREGQPLTDITASPSMVFLVVEAGEPVPWTKPDDLVYDPNGPLPNLWSPFKGGFRACMADASRRFIENGTPEATIRGAILRSGGKIPGW